jgi:hypothetical protein
MAPLGADRTRTGPHDCDRLSDRERRGEQVTLPVTD